MKCPASHDLLQQRLDGLAIESPEWIEHLRGCPDCRALERATRRLQDGLHLLTAPLPPPDFAARIADRVLRDRRRRTRGKARRRWAVTLALAAGLFIALGLRLDWRGPSTAHQDETAGLEATRMKSQPLPNVPSPSLPRVDLASIEPPTRSLREAGQGVSEGLEPVTNSARRAFDLFLRELPPMDGESKGL
jgi:predicted anti-sigma-YlaC factor YlaD